MKVVGSKGLRCEHKLPQERVPVLSPAKVRFYLERSEPLHALLRHGPFGKATPQQSCFPKCETLGLQSPGQIHYLDTGCSVSPQLCKWQRGRRAALHSALYDKFNNRQLEKENWYLNDTKQLLSVPILKEKLRNCREQAALSFKKKRGGGGYLHMHGPIPLFCF